MKNAPRLAINTGVPRVDKKYLGDPESPNFLPDSPLIDRRPISSRQENELKYICSLVLANVKSSDDGGTDPLSEIIQSLQAQEALPVQAAPRPKLQISARTAPKPAAPSRYHPVRNEIRPSHDRKDTNTSNPPSKPAFTESPTALPLSANSNDDAIWAIRSRLSSRPKTSAAACIDYAGENTDPSSHPSNRTTYTTYSTPATSIGNTIGGGKKSYTQGEPALPALDFYGLLSQGDSPSREGTQLHTWMDEQFDRRHQRCSNGLEWPINSLHSLRDFYPSPRQEESEQPKPEARRGSVRTNVQEYFRPGSSLSNAPRQSGIATSIKNYIRPGSSADSIRSVATNTSTLSKAQEHWSSLKRRLSNASRISLRSIRKETEDAGRDGNLYGEGEIDLNRPLPPLPGLDSYKEKKTHIASLMKKVQSSKAGPNIAAPSMDVECPILPDGPTQRYTNHSIPTNFNSMSTTSVESNPTNMYHASLARESMPSLGRLQRRSQTAKAGLVLGVDASLLSQSTVPKAESKGGSFAKKWGGKLSLAKKPKAVVAV